VCHGCLIKPFSDNFWSDLSELAVTFPPKPSTNETRNVATSAIDNYIRPIAFVISIYLFIVVKTVDISFGFDSMIGA
jgi:hypothetical protein